MYQFPLQETEQILRKSLASLSVDGDVFNGAMYLTDERLVFVGYLLDISNKYMEEVPFEHIEAIEPATSLWLIPNAIRISTIRGRALKFVVSGRNEWLEEIDRQLQNVGAGN